MEPNTDMELGNPVAEILAPERELDTFLVIYAVTLRGELSGEAYVQGSVLRQADSLQKALQEVHLFLMKTTIYPVLKDRHIELVTPEFPPNFSGRTLKDVRVSGIPFGSARRSVVLDHDPHALPAPSR